jgi:5'(3')-deoxyribonucleotidase
MPFGFHPPHVKPKEGKLIRFTNDVPVFVDNRIYSVNKETAERYLRALNAELYQPPASVFCSRELEDGLNAYVEECIMILRIPTDEDFRSKACEILDADYTPADDPKLLESFKAMHSLWRSQESDNDNRVTLG